MRWLKDNAGWILLVVIGVAGFFIGKFILNEDPGTLANLRKELSFEKQVIDAKAKTAKDVATKGHAVIAAEIMEQHEEVIEKMNAANKERVEELANDPEALIELCLRATA